MQKNSILRKDKANSGEIPPLFAYFLLERLKDLKELFRIRNLSA